MTDNDRMDLLIKKLDDQGQRLSRIENALTSFAVHEERVFQLTGRVDAMWKKYDLMFSPGGTINQLQTWQATCPKENLEKAINRQWKVIGLILTLNGLVFGKAFGLFG